MARERKLYLVERSDGGVSIAQVALVPPPPLRVGGVPAHVKRYMDSWDAWEQQKAQNAAQKGDVYVPLTITAMNPIEFRDIPASRRLRDARTTGLAVNTPLARELILGDLRAERRVRLDTSDKEFLRLLSVGTPEQKQALDAYRQQLRDFPAVEAPKIDALTVAELEAYRPAWPTPPA